MSVIVGRFSGFGGTSDQENSAACVPKKRQRKDDSDDHILYRKKSRASSCLCKQRVILSGFDTLFIHLCTAAQIPTSYQVATHYYYTC